MEHPDEFPSVHDAYVACGPEGYYRLHGKEYRNPHEPIIEDLIGNVVKDWPVDLAHVLDLAAGSGEITLAIQRLSRAPSPRIGAADPYTGEAYTRRTGLPCEPISFEDIADGALRGRSYSCIACSFAMHLVEESRLPSLCWALAEVAPQLLILTPHKRPIIKPEWGWRLDRETIYQRVRARLYTRL